MQKERLSADSNLYDNRDYFLRKNLNKNDSRSFDYITKFMKCNHVEVIDFIF